MTTFLKMTGAGCACLLLLLFSYLLLGPGCAGGGHTPPPRVERPGLYGLTGWGNWSSDVNGEVGHQFYLSGPRARCEPSRRWTSKYQILSGSLPPGISIGEWYDLKGIPLERGHWIVRLKLYDILCGGEYFKGFEQELRIHITGSGRVIK